MLFRYLRLLTLPVLLLLAACGGGGAAPTANPLDPTLLASAPAIEATVPPSTDSLPTNGAGVKLVAKVNGDEVTLPEFEQALARRQQEVTDAASSGALRLDVLNQLIEGVLIEQGAKTQNIAVTDEQVQAEVQAMKESAGSDEAWNEWLSTNLYTADDFATNLRSTLLTNSVRDSLTADLNGNVNQAHARHILVETEAEAADILTRLNAGDDFVVLASTLSKDESTRLQGGDLGWFTREELLAPELAQVAFSLQPNQIAGPVKSSLGYHVVQTLEIADRPVDPERRVYIAQARFENWLRPLYEKAVIERYLT